MRAQKTLGQVYVAQAANDVHWTGIDVFRYAQSIHANLTESPFQKLDHGTAPSFSNRERCSGADSDLRQLHTIATTVFSSGEHMNSTSPNALDATLARIHANPKYQSLRRRRNRLGWTLTALMLLAYFGYIGLIAFDKDFLARRIGAGVTTLGIPIAMALILFTVVITAYYVWRANREFDRLTAEVLQEARQ